MKLFVWDLHGTLEKGNYKALIEVSNQALRDRGHNIAISPEDSRKYYGLKWHQYFAKILPNETAEEHMALYNHGSKLVEANPKQRLKMVRPNEHMHKVLDGIQEAGHEQILLSNAQHAHIL